eukprot:gnl/Spiro4/22069_TR10857_c0_g1_i1.p1 gnl/Spiro4/22069_TR10857_c0_g1~~gnl/Spiro4/22069_TR10857_c0_g1_i1.p1  ORF type:complete len:373 (-),score=70.58 gnl/Spiro4/22069_TR10857_c0_g1_i1:1-1119(-)
MADKETTSDDSFSDFVFDSVQRPAGVHDDFCGGVPPPPHHRLARSPPPLPQPPLPQPQAYVPRVTRSPPPVGNQGLGNTNTTRGPGPVAISRNRSQSCSNLVRQSSTSNKSRISKSPPPLPPPKFTPAGTNTPCLNQNAYPVPVVAPVARYPSPPPLPPPPPRRQPSMRAGAAANDSTVVVVLTVRDGQVQVDPLNASIISEAVRASAGGTLLGGSRAGTASFPVAVPLRCPASPTVGQRAVSPPPLSGRCPASPLLSARSAVSSSPPPLFPLRRAVPCSRDSPPSTTVFESRGRSHSQPLSPLPRPSSPVFSFPPATVAATGPGVAAGAGAMRPVNRTLDMHPAAQNQVPQPPVVSAYAPPPPPPPPCTLR